jgi:hypothetical protein
MIVSSGQDPVSRRLEAARHTVRLIAARQVDRAPEIGRHIYAELTAKVPEYAIIKDERLEEDIRAVSTAGVVAWLDLVRSGRLPGAEAFEPIREGARRRARQGFDHHALLRAWRIAIRVMWLELIQDPEAQDPLVRQVLPDIAEEAMNYSDQVSLAVTDAYLEESTQIAREHERRRSALLELILSHPREAAAAGHPPELARPHVVVVAETPDVALEGLDQVGLALQRRAMASLWTVRRGAVVAVIPVQVPSGRAGIVSRLRKGFASMRDVERIGVGGEASVMEETRESYLEAADALVIGPALGVALGPVFDIGEIGSYRLLASDRPRCRRFVETTLGSIDLHRTPWLAATLEAYLSRQGRIKEAAISLGVHPNTVKYRLKEVRKDLGQLLLDPNRSAELLIALRLARLLDGAGQVAEHAGLGPVSSSRPRSPVLHGREADALVAG